MLLAGHRQAGGAALAAAASTRGKVTLKLACCSRGPSRVLKLSIRSSADGGSAVPAPGGDEGPKAISLVRQLPGPEFTFVLAGFLKIVTIGGLAYSAPVDAVRTAAGKLSPYLLVPVGLVMCWIAKVIVENELQESRRFMTGLIVCLVGLYFGLYRVLYKYDPRAELPVTTRATSSSRVAQLRAQLGDREIGAPEGRGMMLRDSRSYVQEEGRGKQYDDLAYYEGRYASQMQADEQQAATSAAVLNARNPGRQAFRRS